MAKQTKVSLFRGKRLRVTDLDLAGRPVFGPDSAVVTDGMISVAFTPNVEEGEAITVTNANGDTCVNEPASPTFTGFGVEATFCNVDFALFEKLTGHPVVLNDDGDIVGITEGTTIDVSSVNFALELWTGASSEGSARTGAEGKWGYILAPFLRGGTIGDVTVENAAITFTVTGMQTKNGGAWGKGPYAVDLVGGVAALLHDGLDSTDHRRIQAVEIKPPATYEGSVPVLDPTDAALTDITVTGTALAKTFAPAPVGTEPVWYDFGDGNSDYAETGGYTHTYAAAGTYTVTARRGLSKVTKSVTVTA